MVFTEFLGDRDGLRFWVGVSSCEDDVGQGFHVRVNVSDASSRAELDAFEFQLMPMFKDKPVSRGRLEQTIDDLKRELGLLPSFESRETVRLCLTRKAQGIAKKYSRSPEVARRWIKDSDFNFVYVTGEE